MKLGSSSMPMLRAPVQSETSNGTWPNPEPRSMKRSLLEMGGCGDHGEDVAGGCGLVKDVFGAGVEGFVGWLVELQDAGDQFVEVVVADGGRVCVCAGLLEEVEECGGAMTLLNFVADGLIELAVCALETGGDGGCAAMEFQSWGCASWRWEGERRAGRGRRCGGDSWVASRSVWSVSHCVMRRSKSCTR